MDCSWRKVKLGDLVEYILDYRGKTPNKSGTGIPTLSAKSVKNNWIDYSKVYYISETEYNRFMTKGFPRIGDVLLTMEAPLGLVASLDRDDVGLGQRIVTIRGKYGLLDNSFLKFYLQSPHGQHELHSRATGTTVVGISQKNLKNIEVIVPSYETQVIIGNILDLYESKVEINNKIIANLEEQAQAIFKSWFIDFEPFQNGEFIESELGMIPKGWEVKKLGELFNFIKGKKTKKSSLTENAVPYFVKGVIDGSEKPEFVNPEKVVLINLMDIFMLMDGANSGNIYYGYKGALGSTFSLLKVDKEEINEVLYWYLRINEVNIKNQNTGSAIPHANKDYINNMTIFLPKTLENNQTIRFLHVTREKIILLKNQNIKLAETRDTLLPKLMSGEIDVSNIKINTKENSND